MLLVGDIGGTKTHIALFAARGRRLVPTARRRFISRDYRGLAPILTEFLNEHRVTIRAACFGVAGPVTDGRCEGANLPWVVDARVLRRLLKLKAVALINDLEATAYGIETLPASAFATLQTGRPQPRGTIAVIAAGTGLGEGALVWDGARYRAIPTEGGHADFAPRTEQEIRLLRHLAKKFGHVSYERVLSGPGKLELYRFLRDAGGAREPAWLAAALRKGDASAVVSEMALTRRSTVCVKALDLFVSLYGAEAGNLALKFLARGGVYVGGGIAPHILPKLKDGTFLRAFRDKGRLSPVVSRIPVRVMLDERAALYGAARYGSLLL